MLERRYQEPLPSPSVPLAGDWRRRAWLRGSRGNSLRTQHSSTPYSAISSILVFEVDADHLDDNT